LRTVAVDVEVAPRRLEGKLAVKEISRGTAVLGPENKRRNVSTIEIKLEKKN
jgi:DNA-binding protein